MKEMEKVVQEETFEIVAIMLFLLFRPDPYKNQKVYSKRSVNA